MAETNSSSELSEGKENREVLVIHRQAKELAPRQVALLYGTSQDSFLDGNVFQTIDIGRLPRYNI